jgi:hypothetical protein
LREARTEVTTSIPAPWWNTPYIGMLQGVRTDIIGGQKTLICEYDAGRNPPRVWGVMRLFPKGTTVCRPVPAKGFSCH